METVIAPNRRLLSLVFKGNPELIRAWEALFKVAGAIPELAKSLDVQRDELDGVKTKSEDTRIVVGVAAGAQHLGTFTGNTVPDDVTVKAAIQSLETKIDSAASSIASIQNNVTAILTALGISALDTDFGAFSGALLTDAQSAKSLFQEIETKIESEHPIPMP